MRTLGPRAGGKLTDREVEIMRTVVECSGSTKEAAAKLGLSRTTVRNIRSICYAKVGVDNAVEFWSRVGWLRLPPVH